MSQGINHLLPEDLHLVPREWLSMVCNSWFRGAGIIWPLRVPTNMWYMYTQTSTYLIRTQMYLKKHSNLLGWYVGPELKNGQTENLYIKNPCHCSGLDMSIWWKEPVIFFLMFLSSIVTYLVSSSKNINGLLIVIHGRKALCQCGLQPNVSGPTSFSKASVEPSFSAHQGLGHNLVPHRCGFNVHYLLVSILRYRSSSMRLPDQITPGSHLLIGKSVGLLFPLLTLTRKYRLPLLISRCIKWD